LVVLFSAGSLLRQSYGPPDPFAWDVLNIVPDFLESKDPQFVQDDPTLPQYNLPSMVNAFVDQALLDFQSSLGHHIMWTMGRSILFFSLTRSFLLSSFLFSILLSFFLLSLSFPLSFFLSFFSFFQALISSILLPTSGF
jgi:hypothetical protein